MLGKRQYFLSLELTALCLDSQEVDGCVCIFWGERANRAANPRITVCLFGPTAFWGSRRHLDRQSDEMAGGRGMKTTENTERGAPAGRVPSRKTRAWKISSIRTPLRRVISAFLTLLIVGCVPAGSILAFGYEEKPAESTGAVYSVLYYQIDEAAQSEVLLGEAQGFAEEADSEIVLQPGTAAGQLDYLRPDGFESGVQATSATALADGSAVIRVEYRPILAEMAAADMAAEETEEVLVAEEEPLPQSQPNSSGILDIIPGYDFDDTGMVRLSFFGESSNGKFKVEYVFFDEDEEGGAGILYFLVWKSYEQGGGNRYPESNPVIPGAVEGSISYKPFPATGSDTHLIASCRVNKLTMTGPVRFSWAMGGPGSPQGWSITDGRGEPVPFSEMNTYRVEYYRNINGVRTPDAPVVITGERRIGSLIPVDMALDELVAEGYEYLSHEPDGAVVEPDPAKNLVVVEYNKEETASLTVAKRVDGYAVGDGPDTEFSFTVKIGYADEESFMLRHGEEAVFTDIPLGTEYTVKEDSCAGYDTSGDVPDPVTLTGDTTVEVVNTVKRYTLKITKSVPEGYAAGDDDTTLFHFHVTIGGNAFDFSLTNGGWEEFHDYPHGTVFSISEDARRGYEVKGEVSDEVLVGDSSITVENVVIQNLIVTYLPGLHGDFPAEVHRDIRYGSPTPEYNQGREPKGEPGYTFAGWLPTPAQRVTANATYVAQWTANTYEVTFDAQGGSAPVPLSKNVDFGKMYGSLSTTIRQGYSFAGWFTDPVGGSRISESSLVSIPSDHTLYAHWSALGDTPYTVNHWLVSTTGVITLGASETLTGTTGSTVTASARTFAGYSLTRHADTVATGVIAGDGSLVLRLYYAADPVVPVTPAITPLVLPVIPADTVDVVTPPVPTTEPPVVQESIISDEEVPLGTIESTWAMANLILTIAGILLALIVLALYFTDLSEKEQGKRRGDVVYSRAEGGEASGEKAGEAEKSLIWRILSLAGAAAAIVLFVLTQNVTQTMVFVDVWTILHVIILVTQIVLAILATRGRDVDREEGKKEVAYQ